MDDLTLLLLELVQRHAELDVVLDRHTANARENGDPAASRRLADLQAALRTATVAITAITGITVPDAGAPDAGVVIGIRSDRPLDLVDWDKFADWVVDTTPPDRREDLLRSLLRQSIRSLIRYTEPPPASRR